MQRTKAETMEVKKGRSTSVENAQNLVNFVGDVKQEFKKIEWTSKDEIKSYTKIVLASTFIFGMFVYVIDLMIQGFLGGISLLVKFFTG